MRRYLAAVVAKEFGVSPLAMLREMESDPNDTSLTCYELLQYGKAKATFDASSKSEHGDQLLKPWEGTKVMAEVEQNWAELRHDRMHDERQPDCAGCVRKFGEEVE